MLVKGDPGIGKTSLLKRIASDWAKGIFTAFSVVFFVFLKLVKPGDAIENVIIDQMPFLEGMGVTPCKLMDVLETPGNKCLLILDGLDEHALGKNRDVQKIVKGQKLLYTNIILSSRPHSTRDIERYFPTIVRVQGFTYLEAEKFAVKILRDRDKVSTVLSFSPSGMTEKSLQQSPILLSFICLLVREENLNLLEKGHDIGYLFTRMVRCLYRKFLIRKGVEFSTERFISTMISVGKLALETLVSGNPLMQRNRIITEVGPDAFDYGLLIGHEDFRLIKDETADIVITFSHRSIQEFLGALFFIFSLSEGLSITDLLGPNQKSIFFTNSLFLHFCLWFLYSDQEYFPLTKKCQARETLRTYGLKICRNNEFITSDIAAFYPTMDVREAFERNDNLLLNFLEDVFSHYSELKIIVLESTDPIAWILTSMRPVLNSIQELLVLSDRLRSKERSGDHVRLKVTHFGSSKHVDIDMDRDDFEMIKNYLQYFDVLTCCLSLRWGRTHLFIRAKHDCLERIMESFIDSARYISMSALFPCLTEFSLSNENVGRDFCVAFANAGTLPVLQTLGFIECSGLYGKLAQLLQRRFPSLSVLNLFRTNIDASDFQALSMALNNEDRVLPQLSSLIVTVTAVMDNFEPVIIFFNENPSRFQELFIECRNDKSIFHERFSCSDMQNLKGLGFSNASKSVFLKQIKQLTSLQSLILSSCSIDQNDLKILADITVGYEMTYLEISYNPGISCKLSVLLDRTYPSLDTLVLGNCELTGHDLKSLVLANAGGRLPKLKHLDISSNKLWHDACAFFSSDCKWDNLISLDVTDNMIGIKTRGFIVELSERLSSGYLQSLQELNFTNNEESWNVEAKCEQLQTLRITRYSSKCMGRIVSALHQGMFPALRSVCLGAFRDSGYDARLKCESVRKLTQFGVLCHEAIPSTNPFARNCCLCRHTQM